MASTYEQISAVLTSEGLRHHVDEDNSYITTGFKTENYTNPDKENNIQLIVKLTEKGKFIEIVAPQCYSYPEGPHKTAVFQTCLMISWMTKMVQFEYDPSDGEVRAIIEFPLEDALLTQKQLLRCLHGLTQIIDKYDGMLRGAMKTGQIVPPQDEKVKLDESVKKMLENYVTALIDKDKEDAIKILEAHLSELKCAAVTPPSTEIDLEE